MTEGRLILMRHGETEYNKQSLMTGRRDVPLTEKGIQQARDAGLVLRGHFIHKTYSSTLSRAFNTAALALKAAALENLAIEQRAELVELDTGDFTGRCHHTDPEITAFGRTYARRLPGGESTEDVVKRVTQFYEKEVVPRLARGETVLIVAHAGILRAFDYIVGNRKVDGSNVRSEEHTSEL